MDTAPHWVQEGWGMSDAIREAFEKWYQSEFKRQPKEGGYETHIAEKAWQAALQSGEPVVDVTGMDEEDAMFTQIEAKARATYRRHAFSARGQIITRADSYESHLVWAAIDWAKANATPQPVVDKTKVQTVDDLGDWLCREMELELAKASHRTLTVDAAKINTIKEVAKLIRFYRDNLLSAGKGTV